MKAIKVFLPVESATVGTSGFMDELKQLLPNFLFSEEYEVDNPSHFIIEKLLSHNIGGLLISVQRNDLANLAIMALEKKIPTIFFSERKFAGLDLDSMYFISRIKKIENNFVIDDVSCNKNEGADKLARMIIDSLPIKEN